METFSSDDIVSKYITDANVRRTYLESVYRYLVKRKYFKLVRQLLEEKIPPLYDVVLSPPNSISETLLQMIQHPLRLMCVTNKITSNEHVPNNSTECLSTSLISNECASLILSSFVEEILVPKYTKPIQLFVIPCLANSNEFPFPHLLQHLSDKIVEKCAHQTVVGTLEHNSVEYSISTSDSTVSIARENSKAIDEVFNSSYVFHAFMILDQLHLNRIKSNATLARNYINVLGYLSGNIRKLQQRSQTLFKQYDTEFDADDAIDSDEEDDRKIESIPIDERDCLLEALTFLNEQTRVEIILDNIDNCLDDVEILYSLCKICHNLMLYHRTAVFEFRYEAICER